MSKASLALVAAVMFAGASLGSLRTDMPPVVPIVLALAAVATGVFSLIRRSRTPA